MKKITYGDKVFINIPETYENEEGVCVTKHKLRDPQTERVKMKRYKYRVTLHYSFLTKHPITPSRSRK